MNYMSQTEMNASCAKGDSASKNSSPLDETEFIDVSAMEDLDNDDNWLCDTNQGCGKTKMHYPQAYNNCNFDTEVLCSSKENRRSIDTRTFTRAKRRSSRPSFESVLSNADSPIGPQKTEFFINSTSTPLPFKLQGEASSIPHMLRPNFKNFTPFVNDVSPLHENMEDFLKLSESKGADSFMNMLEPSLNDIISNESQPSILYSSLMTTSSRDETSLTNDILTNSMMQTSMFDEMKDVSIPFETENLNDTIIKSDQIFNNHNETLTKVHNETLTKIHNETLTKIHNETLTKSSMFLDGITFPSDTTLMEMEKSSNDSLNNTYSKTIVEHVNLPTKETVYSPRRETFIVNNTQRSPISPLENFNSTIQHMSTPKKNDQLNRTFDAIKPNTTPSPKLNSTFSTSSPHEDVVLDTNFETAKEQDKLNLTFDANKTYDTVKPKVVSSLRQELLKEVRRSEHETQKENFDITYDMNNDAQKGSRLVEKNQLDRKHTFTVKNNNTFVKKDEGQLNSTFSKPTEMKRVPRRLPGPTIFSKNSYLQKSNPNLNLNADNVGRPSLLKFPRGSQPNIAASLQKNSLGRFKGGSEQRLKDTTIDFHATSGSTESIESTQSAHSAPDFDDRLSNCSENSSRGSYTIGRMDSDQLHKIAQLQEESLKYESTPKPNKGVSTFTKSKDLPSPISKHEQEVSEKVKRVPRSEIESLKTAGTASKPNPNETRIIDTPTKNLENPIKRQSKMVQPAEVKSKLRQPMSLNSANRPLSSASGIPRPSRIPAPKATRPKTAQNEMKKSYM